MLILLLPPPPLRCPPAYPPYDQGARKSRTFSDRQLSIAKKARLTGREPAMKLASKLLAEALRAQIEVIQRGGLFVLSMLSNPPRRLNAHRRLIDSLVEV